LQCDRFDDLLDDTTDWLTARREPSLPCFG